MKVPVQWLAEFIEVDSIGLDRLADVLTMAGLEVEELISSPIGPVFVTKVTPNRGDWMSVYGVAREAAAALAETEAVDLKDSKLGVGDLPTAPLPIPIRIDVPDWCPRYAAMIVEIDDVGVSPDWMQARLAAAGMRPINAVVDITNYVMIELGQPLHAFDLDTMAGPEVVVRAARKGETITTLDGKERQLEPTMMVIADRDKATALAGVMGGEASEVTDGTRRILIESAHFSPAIVRAASKALGLSTDASYRFERHVDPANVPRALLAAAQLMKELIGGRIVDGAVDVYPTPTVRRRIPFRPARAERMLGISLKGNRGFTGLAVMGIDWLPGRGGEYELTAMVPTHRPDITLEIDLIEEVGRMIGYDKLPETLPPAMSSTGGGSDSGEGMLLSKLRSILIGQGLTEVFTHTLSAPSIFDDPDASERRVRIRTALSAELSGMRQSLIPNLLDVLGRNARQRNTDINLFEVGSVFSKDGGGYRQSPRAAAVVHGDYTEAKGIVENLFTALCAPTPEVMAQVIHGMHPNRSARLSVNGTDVGFISEVDPDMVTEHLDIPGNFGRVACFELYVDAVYASIPPAIRYYPLPKYPEVTRDLAMVFDAAVPYGRIQSAAFAAAGSYAEYVSLVSIFEGDKIGAGKKSVALRFVLRADDRTLTDADADTAITAAKTALTEQLGAEQRKVKLEGC